MSERRHEPSAASPSELVRCDGGDGWGCFIPHAHCVCEDEGTPGMRRPENLHVGPPNPETKWS